MILKSFPVVMAHESPRVVEFFESAIYQTMTMQTPLLVPWPDDLEEFCFPCNTSIISQELVMEMMCNKAAIKNDEPVVQDRISKRDKIKLYEEKLRLIEEEKERI